MKRFVFHVGPDKTGTSAIQKWCNENRDLLSKQGIHYPRHAVDANGVSSGNGMRILQTAQLGFALNPEALQALLVDFSQSNCHTLLVSSENLWWVMADLQHHIPGCEVIFYIRLEASYEESSYNQSVKRHGVTRKFSPAHATHRFLKVPFTELDTRRTHFRFFDPALLVGNNVLTDLFAAANIGFSPPPTSESINTSYQFEALEFKRFTNFFIHDQLLASEIDQALQSYTHGTSYYTLLSESYRDEKNRFLADQIHGINQRFGLELSDIDSYYLNICKRINPPRKEQNLEVNDFQSVIDFIGKKSKSAPDRIFAQLREAVIQQPTLEQDYPWIKSSLDTSASIRNA